VNASLAEFVVEHPDLLVLTGAGLSTASGIGDYRGEDGVWKRRPPVELRDFLRSDHARHRYWSRSLFGWPHFAAAEPNAGHRALARLDRAGRLVGTVTQNVDGLHARAGHDGVIELHGCLADVDCLQCGQRFARAAVQRWLSAANPSFAGRIVELRADGDAELAASDLDRFVVPNCPTCEGLLKPGVVFFGESVPRASVEQVYALLARASALLLVGTSVMVYSGFRFCRAAHEQGKPIVSINRGVTRADALLAFKVDGACVQVLDELANALDLCFDS
jgi:NAD-dependent SIR2 family protein deacetylase